MSNGLITRQELGQDLKEEFDKINVLTALPTTTGVANTYSVNIARLSDLIPGLKVTIKFHQASNGASTLNINEFGAIGIIKPGGGSPNLKAGGIYTLVHDGVNFQLQGEGGEYGTALANDVLTGKTIGTEDGVISGTMSNRGAVNIIPSQVDQVIASGYHNGSGKVSKVVVPVANVLTGTTIAGAAGTMPNRGAPAQTLTAQGGQYNIPAGYYSGGSIKAQFTNLTSENIKNGVNIGGVVGTLKQFDKITAKTNLVLSTKKIDFVGEYVGAVLSLSGAQTLGATAYNSNSTFFASDIGTITIKANQLTATLEFIRIGNRVTAELTQSWSNGQSYGDAQGYVTILSI